MLYSPPHPTFAMIPLSLCTFIETGNPSILMVDRVTFPSDSTVNDLIHYLGMNIHVSERYQRMKHDLETRAINYPGISSSLHHSHRGTSPLLRNEGDRGTDPLYTRSLSKSPGLLQNIMKKAMPGPAGVSKEEVKGLGEGLESGSKTSRRRTGAGPAGGGSTGSAGRKGELALLDEHDLPVDGSVELSELIDVTNHSFVYTRQVLYDPLPDPSMMSSSTSSQEPNDINMYAASSVNTPTTSPTTSPSSTSPLLFTYPPNLLPIRVHFTLNGGDSVADGEDYEYDPDLIFTIVGAAFNAMTVLLVVGLVWIGWDIGKEGVNMLVSLWKKRKERLAMKEDVVETDKKEEEEGTKVADEEKPIENVSVADVIKANQSEVVKETSATNPGNAEQLTRVSDRKPLNNAGNVDNLANSRHVGLVDVLVRQHAKKRPDVQVDEQANKEDQHKGNGEMGNIGR